MRDLSRDLERLLHLAKLGDAAAADRLWTEAQRRGDRALATEAALSSGDLSRAAEVAAAYWAASSWADLTAFCQRMGLDINEDWIAKVQSMIKEAHSARRVRLISPAHILQCAFAARWAAPSPLNVPTLAPAFDPQDPSGGAFTLLTARHRDVAMASIHAGIKKAGMGSPQTTFCLAIFDAAKARLTLSVKSVSAASPNPSSAWPTEVRPWKRNLLDNLPRLAKWATLPSIDRIQAPTCDAARAAQATYTAAAAEAQVADPLADLDALLQATPSPQPFKAIVAFLDDWPDDDQPHLLAVALPRALAALADHWPDDVRVITRAHFTRLHRHPTKRRPSDDLYRHLDLSDASADDASALQNWPLSPQLTHLSLSLRDSTALAALVDARAAFTSLHTLTLTSVAQYPRPLIDIHDLLSSPPWPALKTLHISFDSAHIGALISANALENIETLDVNNLNPGRNHRRFSPEQLQRIEASRGLIASLSSAPLSSLRALTTSDPLVLEAITKNPALPALRSLHIRGNTAAEMASTWQALCVHPTLRLHCLTCDGFSPDLAHLRALFASPAFADLRDLTLRLTFHGDPLCDLLAPLPNLTSLRLAPSVGLYHKAPDTLRSVVTDAGLRALSARPPSLESLALPNHALTSTGVAALLSSPAVALLRELDLTNNRLDAAAALALASSPHLSNLHTLHLSTNPIGSDGLRALASSPHLNNLHTLHLERCDIGLEGFRALVASPHLPALREVTLSHNPLTHRAADLLAAHPAMGRLQRIHLYHTGISKRGVDILAATPWLRGRFDGLPGYSATFWR